VLKYTFSHYLSIGVCDFRLWLPALLDLHQSRCMLYLHLPQRLLRLLLLLHQLHALLLRWSVIR
jgi:hypothetical protein